MTLEQLIELSLTELESEFGEHIAEEIAQCKDLEALTQLSLLVCRRIDELIGVEDFEHNVRA